MDAALIIKIEQIVALCWMIAILTGAWILRCWLKDTAQWRYKMQVLVKRKKELERLKENHATTRTNL